MREAISPGTSELEEEARGDRAETLISGERTRSLRCAGKE